MKLFKRLLLPLCFFLCLSFATVVNAQDNLTSEGWEKKDYVTYFGTTDKPVTVSWDAASGAAHYEVHIYCVERKQEIDLGTTTDIKKTIQIPKSGHYVAKVRTVNAQNQKSDWAESTNPAYATVDGQPKAWWIYGHVAKPGALNLGKLIIGDNYGGVG